MASSAAGELTLGALKGTVKRRLKNLEKSSCRELQLRVSMAAYRPEVRCRSGGKGDIGSISVRAAWRVISGRTPAIIVGRALLEEPAFLRNVEDDAVRVLELALEVHIFLRLAQVEEKRAACRLDFF